MKDIWQSRGTFFMGTTWGLGGEVLLASRGWRPGTLLNILQGTGQGPPGELSSPYVHRAKVRSPVPSPP